MAYNQGVKILNLQELRQKSLHELVMIRDNVENHVYDNNMDAETWERLLKYFETVKRELLAMQKHQSQMNLVGK
jgi:hypothetical protein